MLKSLYTNLFVVSLALVSVLTPGVAYNDSPERWQIGFQDGASPVQEGISELFDTVFFYIIVIVFGVGWGVYSVVKNFHYQRSPIVHHINHGTVLELVWTIAPAFILVAIAFPSFKLLYLTDEVFTPSMTIKAAGHQWYWSYEYSDFLNDDGE